MSKFKIRWNTERLLSLSAMTISFITLIIFVYQTNLMRKQNYLSILPYLMLSTTYDNAASTFELNLKNHGVGPAIIESTVLTYKGKRYDLSDYDDHFHILLKRLVPALDSVQIISYGSLNKGLAIPAGTNYNVIRVANAPDDYQLITTTLEQLLTEGLEYEIVYKSIQHERWRIQGGSEEPQAMH